MWLNGSSADSVSATLLQKTAISSGNLGHLQAAGLSEVVSFLTTALAPFGHRSKDGNAPFFGISGLTAVSPKSDLAKWAVRVGDAIAQLRGGAFDRRPTVPRMYFVKLPIKYKYSKH